MNQEQSEKPSDAPSTHADGIQPSESFVAEQQQEKAETKPEPPAPAQNVYPDPGKKADWQPLKSPELRDEQYKQASFDLNEFITLVAGIASATLYIIVGYFTKSAMATAVVAVALAAVAIFYAITNYRVSSRMTPLSVIGVSAATVTMIYVANMLIAQVMVRSILNGSGY
jgi:VIT1/CCC1 family predicted Fe2+/Mn2+ transporter